jgi:hypothetical protein
MKPAFLGFKKITKTNGSLIMIFFKNKTSEFFTSKT